MLKWNHGRVRRAAGLLIAGALAFGGLATASAAHDPATGEKVFQKKVVIRSGEDGKDVLVDSEGKPVALNCPGEKFETSASGGTSDRKQEVKFFLCVDKGESLLAALEKAETDLQKHDEMPAAHKAEILKQIRAKIAELRARG